MRKSAFRMALKDVGEMLLFAFLVAIFAIALVGG